jgi:hypothetical protein
MRVFDLEFILEKLILLGMSVPFIEIVSRDSFLTLLNDTNTAFEGLADRPCSWPSLNHSYLGDQITSTVYINLSILICQTISFPSLLPKNLFCATVSLFSLVNLACVKFYIISFSKILWDLNL